MAAQRYELTAAQAAFLKSVERTPPSGGKPRLRPAKVCFPGALPPITDQSVRGTCVANAAAALVACYEGCRRRVSVQYLDEVTRLVEQAWVARNLKRLTAGEPPEKDFEAAFPEAVSQAVLLVRANGSGSEAASAFVRSLGVKIRERIEADAGCRLKRCFEALEEYGVCREELWPYSPVALNAGAAGGDAVGAFPPGTHEDARRHRLVNGLYILRAPNNVDEIKGILAGAQGRRPMPVCAGLELFEGRTDGCFVPPDVVREDGRAYAVQRPLGIHEVLIVGFRDDAAAPGGGFFTFRNSWGRDWGDGGTGSVSYAYVACFCREAGTILQEPDDYGPVMAPQRRDESYVIARRRATMLCAVGICLLAASVSVAVAVWAMHRAAVRAETTVVAPVPVPEPPVAPSNPPAVTASAPCPTSPPPAVARPAATPPPAAKDDEDDDSFAVERIVDYRYRMRGTCETAAEARAMVRLLDGKHREFAFEDLTVSDEGRSFEGDVTIEGLAGRPPHALQAIEEFFKRKKAESAVRKWSVRRLR